MSPSTQELTDRPRFFRTLGQLSFFLYLFLPYVLLDIRSTFKTLLKKTVAELGYATTLHLHEEYHAVTPDTSFPAFDNVHGLREFLLTS